MIITCEACGTSFKLKTSLVKETGSTVRCSKCQRVFIAYPPSVGGEKKAGFKLDESLEAKIDNFLGDELDDIESEISLETAEISMTASDEKVPGGTFEDEFSDFESEISMETAEITMSTSEDLFDSTTSLLDALEEGDESPEIMMSELLQDDDDIVPMDDLVSGKTSETIDMDDLLADTDGGDADIMSFDDLKPKTTEDDDLGALLEEGEASDIMSLDTFEKTEDMVAPVATTEEPEQDESMVVLDDVESEEAFEGPVSEEPFSEDRIALKDAEDSAEERDLSEPEQILVETKGGVDADLDETDITQEPEKGKKTGKPETKPLKETAVPADEEEFELDFDLEAEEPAEAVSEKDAGVEEDFDLDFDLDEAEAVSEKAGEEKDAFEMDLDLDIPEAKTSAADEEDFELDFDLETEEPAPASKKKDADSDDLDLDLEGFEDLDLADASSEATLDDDLGLDLDEFDNLDMDEALEKEPDADHGETLEDFDFDLDLEETSSQPAEAGAEKEDFDLDFDLEADEAPAKAADEAEDFNLDLDIAPEATEVKSDVDDFELDLDDTFEDKTVTVDETLMMDDATEDKSEELDLTQIEDVLDFDEAPKPRTVREEIVRKTVVAEMEEPEMFTASDEDEMNIDLETILDEEERSEAGDKKEISLETVEEREKQIERQYRKTVIEEEPAAEESAEDLTREFEDGFKMGAPAAMAATMAQRPAGKSSGILKKTLLAVLILAVIGAIGFVAWKMLGGREEAPAPAVPPAVKEQVKDLGYLQMEMVDTPAYKFVENTISGELLVINGSVTNRYDHPRSNVQVKGTLYNTAGKVIISSTVYGGNMFSDVELTSLDIKTIEGRLSNRMGDNRMNVDIQPGQSVPFTVVFKNLPADMDQFAVEVAASAK